MLKKLNLSYVFCDRIVIILKPLTKIKLKLQQKYLLAFILLCKKFRTLQHFFLTTPFYFQLKRFFPCTAHKHAQEESGPATNRVAALQPPAQMAPSGGEDPQPELHLQPDHLPAPHRRLDQEEPGRGSRSLHQGRPRKRVRRVHHSGEIVFVSAASLL